MAVRVAINGFGRIGRCLTRLMAATDNDLELVAINSRADMARDVHLLTYDSVHGRFPGTVAAHGENIVINGREVRVTRIMDPKGLPWKELGVDIVLESTGAFRDRASNEEHLKAGAQRVILGAPGKIGGRYLCLWGQPPGLRSGPPPDHLQRLLHHQLPGAGGESAA